MNTTPESASVPAAPSRARAFADRHKPRASARLQLMFAAGLWAIAASILGFRAFTWLSGGSWAVVAAAVLVGVLKARFLLDGVARRGASRIEARGSEACAGGFLSASSWALVLLMIASGHALRLTSLSRMWLGVLYAAVATALLVASRIYWRGAVTTRA